MATHTRIVLAQQIEDRPTPDTFRIETVETPRAGDGEVLVRTQFLSLDPYMRNRLTAMKSYTQGVALGEVVVGETVGHVVESRNPAFEAGQTVIGWGGWQEYHLSNGMDLRVLADNGLSPSLFLGVLGMPGLTAWVALRDIGALREGETVVVPAATGPVGSAAGQIAYRIGARAVGVAGGPEKIHVARETYGFDAVVDHHVPDFAARLAEACPHGVDVYVDTVGGAVLSAVTPLMNVFGRIPLVGTIGDYGELAHPSALNERPALTRAILVNRLTIRGLIVYDHATRRDEFEAEMTPWLLDGSVTCREEVHDGLETTPRAFARMLQSSHTGKIIIRMGED